MNLVLTFQPDNLQLNLSVTQNRDFQGKYIVDEAHIQKLQHKDKNLSMNNLPLYR
jgi:hypothetical protein